MEKILKNQKSIMISSLNKDKEASISYAPFAMKENKKYIYISKTAQHYYNLLNHNKCSVMAIEDEKDSKSIFARERVSFNCEAKKLETVDESIFTLFDEVQGAQMMMVLKTMDFDMFELSLINGRLVKGFGKAFDIEIYDGEFKINQVTGIGHPSK